MAKTAKYRMDHLECRGGWWSARLAVPAALRPQVGLRRFRQALGTQDYAAARRLAAPLVAEWLARIQDARQGQATTREAHWRRMWRSATAVERDVLLEVIAEEGAARAGLPDWQAKDDPDWASDAERQEVERFVAASTGDLVAFLEHLDEHLASLDGHLEAKSIAQRGAAIRRFADSFKYTRDVTKPAVQRWAIGQAKALAPATVRRDLSECRSYWKFLSGVGAVPEESTPFNEISLPAARTSKGSKRQAFKPADVSKLLAAAQDKGDAVLADMIDLARWTGCRIEELGALQVQHVDVDRACITITGGKSEAAAREIPIHPSLAPTLERLIGKRKDGFLVLGLGETKWGDRSTSVGIRFGKMKTTLGYDRRYVFHSIRKTVATLLEDASVPENISAAILGHKLGTMSYGLYSGGPSLATKADAIAKLAYP